MQDYVIYDSSFRRVFYGINSVFVVEDDSDEDYIDSNVHECVIYHVLNDGNMFEAVQESKVMVAKTNKAPHFKFDVQVPKNTKHAKLLNMAAKVSL